MSDVSPAVTKIKEMIAREITPELYHEIRNLWFQHVNNEEHLFIPFTAEEGKKYLGAVMDTLSTDCLFSFPNGEKWQGQKAVREFYEYFITAFKNFDWHPQSVVIGPQGVIDIVQLNAIQLKPFGGLQEINKQVCIQWVIHWPWNTTERKFDGEIVYVLDLVSPSK